MDLEVKKKVLKKIKKKVKKKARKKTGRTEPVGTRATPAFIRDVKRVAFEDGLKTAELLELMLEAYKAQKRKS